MQALWTPSTSPINEVAALQQRFRIAVLKRPLAQLGDDRLL